MADDLFTFKIDESSVDIFGLRILDATEGQIRKGLQAIRREFQAELVRQHRRLQTSWVPLKRTPKDKSYYARKLREYRKGKIPYLRILTRTGALLQGYVHGVYVDNLGLAVGIPYPAGAEIRGKVHQGELPLPKGVLAHRPFQLERFEDIAIKTMDEYI